MSLSDELKAAADEAQTVLAEQGGAAVGKPNSLYNGTPYVAVYGPPQTERMLMPGGGERQRTYLQVTATRSQFAVPPVNARKWVRTDQTPNVTFTIDWVGTHDSTVYTLRLLQLSG